MARAHSPRRQLASTIAEWTVALIIFFPVLWMILTSFKTEASAVAMPPQFLSADWTLENYAEVWQRSDYPRFFWNSVVISIGSTLLGLAVAIPAAWSMAFVPGKRTKDLLMWMLSTKMMPAVGVLIPMYLLFQQLVLDFTHFFIDPGRNTAHQTGFFGKWNKHRRRHRSQLWMLPADKCLNTAGLLCADLQ